MPVFALLLFLPTAALADSVVATRTIRAQQLIGPQDVTVVADDIPGAATRLDEAVGREARLTLYAGRPIMARDLAEPAVIERNAPVEIGYRMGGLQIRAEGRALARGRVGETVRVMNLGSRVTLFGRVESDGSVRVGDLP